MSKHKDEIRKKKKGSQFVIRLDKDERDAFVSLCDALDTSAAREIRRFMRDWVAANRTKSMVEPAPQAPVAPPEPDTSAPKDAPPNATRTHSDPTADPAAKPKPRRKAAVK